MIVYVDFGLLNTFDCVYGEFEVGATSLKVYVVGGLEIPYCKVVELDGRPQLIRCGAAVSDGESLFSKHYLYDPSKNTEYVSWSYENGILTASTLERGRSEYKCKSETSHGLHEYVGGCWFIFEGLSFAERKVSEYAPDRKSSTGVTHILQWSGQEGELPGLREYLLEGVLEVSPGPGWMSCQIVAKEFYIEL